MQPRWIRCAAPLLLLASGLALAFSSGPPASETGAAATGSAPAEGTCQLCHSGNTLNTSGTLSILNVPAVYKPDSQYIFTVQLSSTQNSSFANRKWGFEITAVNAGTGGGFGTLARSHADTSTTQIVNGAGNFSTRRYVEHNSSGTRTGLASPVSWTLRWTAPNAASSTVRALFFAAGNAANGDGSSSGDWIYTASAAALPPARVSSTASLVFGTVIVGANAQQTLQVGNSTPSPGDVLSYSLTAPAGFAAPGGTFTANAGAAPNSHTITMITSAAATLSGNLVIASNDPVAPSKNVPLSGTVLDHCQPSLDGTTIVVSDTLDFGLRSAGTFSDSSVSVFNLGFGATRARLSLSAATITGGASHFTIPGGFTPQLVGAAPASIPVHFADAGATFDSTYSADLTFTCADEALPGGTSQPGLAVKLFARAHVGNVAVGGNRPPADRLLPARPNPARGRTQLGFDLARRGAVTLGVYDVNGRRVRSLVRATLDPGRYPIEWDGADDRGAALPAGVYIVRFASPGLGAAERLALVR
jgi:hypothetical protein